MQTAFEVTPQFDELAFGSITANSAGTANALQTWTKNKALAEIVNTTNVDLIVTHNGAAWRRVPAGKSAVINLRTNGVMMGGNAAGVVVGVYCPGAAPGSGYLSITSYGATRS